MSLILMSLDPLGGMSLEGTLGVTKRQSKGVTLGLCQQAFCSPVCRGTSSFPNLSF